MHKIDFSPRTAPNAYAIHWQNQQTVLDANFITSLHHANPSQVKPTTQKLKKKKRKVMSEFVCCFPIAVFVIGMYHIIIAIYWHVHAHKRALFGPVIINVFGLVVFAALYVCRHNFFALFFVFSPNLKLLNRMIGHVANIDDNMQANACDGGVRVTPTRNRIAVAFRNYRWHAVCFIPLRLRKFGINYELWIIMNGLKKKLLTHDIVVNLEFVSYLLSHNETPSQRIHT